jgi:hypothetical protein
MVTVLQLFWSLLSSASVTQLSSKAMVRGRWWGTLNEGKL